MTVTESAEESRRIVLDHLDEDVSAVFLHVTKHRLKNGMDATVPSQDCTRPIDSDLVCACNSIVEGLATTLLSSTDGDL